MGTNLSIQQAQAWKVPCCGEVLLPNPHTKQPPACVGGMVCSNFLMPIALKPPWPPLPLQLTELHQAQRVRQRHQQLWEMHCEICDTQQNPSILQGSSAVQTRSRGSLRWERSPVHPPLPALSPRLSQAVMVPSDLMEGFAYALKPA